MLRFLKNKQGFTLIELVIIIILVGVLAAIAIPRYVDLRNNAVEAAAQATLDAGRAAINLNFAQGVLSGNYTDPFANTTGADQVMTNASDVASLEAMLQSTPNYPPDGTYNSGPNVGFRWVQVTDGTYGSANPNPPVFDGVIDATCTAANARGGTADNDCWVSKL
jgi:prepilin-type N-terminal cleavage/methylation domain-containing protein